jgi:hypothetical protein
VDGWHPVEDVIRWGFAQSPVVMANEAHSGLARCIRTREVGLRMVRAAHECGVRRLAMEALPAPAPGPPRPVPGPPEPESGYLAQPEMRRLIQGTLDLGWTLWAYESIPGPGTEGIDRVNARERGQAENLGQVVAAAPDEPLLVWCGNSHAAKVPIEDWRPMGQQFRALSDIDPCVIDQTVTVAFEGRGAPGVLESLAAGPLADYGGTAGIRREQAPGPLRHLAGVDVVILSTDNALT